MIKIIIIILNMKIVTIIIQNLNIILLINRAELIFNKGLIQNLSWIRVNMTHACHWLINGSRFTADTQTLLLFPPKDSLKLRIYLLTQYCSTIEDCTFASYAELFTCG